MKKVIILLIGLFAWNFLFAEKQFENNSFAKEATANTPSETAQYLKLRLDYSKSEEYNPYDSDINNIKKECARLINENKFKEAIEKASAGLKKDKYNISLLIDLAIAYRKTQDIKNADKYRNLWRALMDSIFASGDGKSAKTAFTVISVDEEYAVLEVLKLKCAGQKHVVIDGNNFDILKVKSEPAGAEFDLYFNIDIPFKWLIKSVDSKK